mgnify:CR=1 FL=1
MDSTNYNEILQKTLSNIDDIKDELDSEKYLEITNNLSSLYKILDNNFYEIRYVTQRFTKSGLNHYAAMPKVQKEIIKLTSEEHTELEKKLNDSEYFINCNCNMLLAGIKERLSTPSYTELVGVFQSNCHDDEEHIDEIFDKTFELTIQPTLAIIGCKKL